MLDQFTCEDLGARCAGDGEFLLAARHWNGGFRFESPARTVGLRLTRGAPVAQLPAADEDGVITLTAEDDAWADLLAPVPQRFCNDISGLIATRRMGRSGGEVLFAQYYPAVMRAVELLRDAPAVPEPSPKRPAGSFDSPIGRYIHLDIAGQDHRIYFEEAGRGIPLLLQHTAGSHGAQWRHLFERREITDHFRLIAYDLPFHGKSLPPTGPQWWAEEYRLTKETLRAIPVALVQALGLGRCAFMGCSVGGLLALDLARHHPESFFAVISLEGALKIETPWESLETLWHPQVGNEYKARFMNALMAPTSPAAYRKETSAVYASGWPPSFRGDLWYYVADYDLREDAADIDTALVSVDILTGEYDSSGTPEHGQAAAAAIPGATWTLMPGIGHFPMSENPTAFLPHLLPVLERIRTRPAGVSISPETLRRA
jgi:pimeloyl-ACP methyl ester carboxylesterase